MSKSLLQMAPQPAKPLSQVQRILQRKCDCGNHTVAGGLCEDCAKQRNVLQRAANSQNTLGSGLSQSHVQVIQAKLIVGAINDPLEEEADRVSDQVMAAPGHPAVSGAPPRIQHFSGQPGGQTKAAPASVDQAMSSPSKPLDPELRQDMEQRFGHDFSRVRVHTESLAARSAEKVAANAYTVGRHIVFGAGQYAPHTQSGRRLLAHELVHTVQQGSANTLRRQPSAAAKDPPSKRYLIKIPAGVTTITQWERYIEVQIFGRVINTTWTHHSKALEQPAKNVGKPINVRVDTATLEKFGIGEGGRDTEADKAGKAAAEKEFKALGKAEQDAINREIDVRYSDSTQETLGALIKKGETGKAIIWNSLKQDVLADRRKLAQLPEAVKSLLGEANFTPQHYQILVQLGNALSQLSEEELKAFFVAGPNGAVITPADYPQLLSIAEKLAALSPEARKDYLARVTASTTSLNALESSLDDYIQFRAEREKEVAKHEEAAKPLLGAEHVYTLYRNYLSMKSTVALARAMKGAAKDKAEAQESYEYLQDLLQERKTALLTALKHKGFDSIEAFAAALETYRVAFRTQAVNLALDVLAYYEHMLFAERNMLQKGGATAIAQGIGSTKAAEHYKEYHRQEEIASNLRMAKEPKETWWQKPYNEAKSAAASAKASAESEVLRGSGGDPLIKERNIDLEKLAGADTAGVQSYLMQEITRREGNLKTTRQEFKDDPDRVFKLQDLVAATYTTLGVKPDTIYGRVIRDYIQDEADKHLFSQIALGLLAVALALIPGPGWLAAAGLVASAGLSTYQAYQAYQEYQEQTRDYELGFLQEEPSLFWVGVAIAGAALELGVAATVVIKSSAAGLKALKGPMMLFAKDGEIPTLLAKIEAAEGLDLKFKAALTRELKASAAAKEAWKEFGAFGGRVGGFAGMVDPGVAKQFFRALYFSIRRGINTIAKLSADAKFLEIAGDLTKMSGAQRAELEVAFEQVKNLVKTGAAKGMDESSLVNFVDRWALNRGKPGFQTKLLDEMNAWKPLTAEQRKALDALQSQRRQVQALHEDVRVAQEEREALRAKPERTPDEKARIKELDEELNKLDPKAFPLKTQQPGIGQIAEAEQKLAQVETEAARAQLSLYDRMRGAQPSFAQKEAALKAPNVEDVAAPIKTKPTPKQVDHVVSVREISDMDGFANLPLKDQKEIVNMQKNLIGMDGSANASKGERTWTSWNQASSFYERATIDAMIKREAEVRVLIETEIKLRLEKLAAKP